MKTAFLLTRDKWIQMPCKSIDNVMKYEIHNKRAYQTLRNFTKTSPRSNSIIEDNNGKPLADKTNILNRLTESYNYLYNHLINPDTNVLSYTAIFNEESDIELSILNTIVMVAINMQYERR